MNLSAFPAYTRFSPKVPVVCVTPQHSGAIHRFFDTSPISPSGKYLAACILPYEDRLVKPGDKADILLVDLNTGNERIIAHTAGWGAQVGANVQWGNSDSELYFNDVTEDGLDACLVKMDPFGGTTRRMGKGIFMLSPDGRFAITHNLTNGRLTQKGYGVMIPDDKVVHNDCLPKQDGFFLTDTQTGECRLFMPLSRLIEEGLRRRERYQDGGFYGFQCKWSPDGKRIMYVVRWLANNGSGRLNHVFTSDAQGNDIHLALHCDEWAKGGHHVNWHPDSCRITMNLRLNSDDLRLVSFNWDGSDLHSLRNDTIGSGHPTVYRDGRFMLMDAYAVSDVVAYPDGTIPIRMVDLQNGRECELIRMASRTGLASDLRLDPHPAWSRDWRYITFNGFEGGTRRVYIADMKDALSLMQ